MNTAELIDMLFSIIEDMTLLMRKLAWTVEQMEILTEGECSELKDLEKRLSEIGIEMQNN